MSIKRIVTISIDNDIDKFMEDMKTKVVNIDGRKIIIHRKKSEIYQKALEFAMENANQWVV